MYGDNSPYAFRNLAMVSQEFPAGPATGDGPDVTEDVWNYIDDMLSQLADLAAKNGRYDLATTLRLAAVEAARIGD
jgi:hypothetical protein